MLPESWHIQLDVLFNTQIRFYGNTATRTNIGIISGVLDIFMVQLLLLMYYCILCCSFNFIRSILGRWSWESPLLFRNIYWLISKLSIIYFKFSLNQPQHCRNCPDGAKVLSSFWRKRSAKTEREKMAGGDSEINFEFLTSTMMKIPIDSEDVLPMNCGEEMAFVEEDWEEVQNWERFLPWVEWWGQECSIMKCSSKSWCL